jgi:adenine-specific DNA-methyltransferase
MASTQYEKLQRLLRELFRTNQADLDFGIYRVINQKRDEVEQFLEKDLLPQVKAAFGEYQSVDNQLLNAELQEEIKQAEKMGFDPNQSTTVKKIKEQMATYGVDVEELENQVYAALYNFFRRYYDKGDFISQRRYKEGVYAIPYEGEEVKLHWANHDQYYVKTSEHLRNYTFKLESGELAHVKLVSADTEKDNRKEGDDKKRRFILADDPIEVDGGQLALRFEFRPDAEKRKQEKLNKEAVETIFALRDSLDDPIIKTALMELSTLAPTEKDKKRTLLAKHLDDYTRRNTQDYFIHKDLGKFLRQELDFFIKNEIMHLDDIESETAPRVEQYLSKIKVIRKIAHKMIAFLAQIEDFQKKLWLKKKFVVETNYCITLDRVPEELYPTIAANDAQRKEWVQLFAIDEIEVDLLAPAYSEPLTIEFLKANPILALDTKFFDSDFKYELLASIESLDESLNGLLVHSENFQLINLILEKYQNSLKCIYIDPPYNAKSSEILYKNNFRDSSWLSLMQNRINLSKRLLKESGVYIVAIDENEQENLGKLLSMEFPFHKRTCVTVVHNPGGIQGKNFSYSHEFAYFVHPDDGKEYIGKIKRDDVNKVPLRDWGGDDSTRESARNCFYPIIVDNDNVIIGFGDISSDDYHPGKSNIVNKDGTISIYPIDGDGKERKWRNSRQSVEGILDELICEDRNGEKTIIRLKSIYRYKTTWLEKKYSSNTHGTQFVNHIHKVENSNLYPKSIYTMIDTINAVTQKSPDSIVLDFFAGSGSTGHSVIELNRKDNSRGKRKYILAEMGQYFDTILKPRIQKVIYSQDWKDGKPLSRKGSSHAFKYLKLESYEDTLNNLELARNDKQGETLFGAEAFKEEYLLSYMLDVESKGSLLSVQNFERPFDYKLEIATDTVGETVSKKVDLVETFNYLIGLEVAHISRIQGVVVVEGTTRQEEKTLVIWRNVHEMDNEKLDKFFEKLDIRTRDFEYDVIYVNGDNNLPNLRTPDERWKVRLIEEDFLRLMFDVEGN